MMTAENSACRHATGMPAHSRTGTTAQDYTLFSEKYRESPRAEPPHRGMRNAVSDKAAEPMDMKQSLFAKRTFYEKRQAVCHKSVSHDIF